MTLGRKAGEDKEVPVERGGRPLFSTARFDGTAAATTATGDGGASAEPSPAESAEGEDDDDGR